MDYAVEAKKIALKHAKEMAAEFGAMLIFPALEQAVAVSKSPVDNVVLAALEPELKKAFADLIAKIEA